LALDEGEWYREQFSTLVPIYETIYTVAAWSSETSLSYNITTWRHNPDHNNLNLHRRENLKTPYNSEKLNNPRRIRTLITKCR